MLSILEICMLEYCQLIWGLSELILKIFIQYLLCSKHYARYQGCDEQNRTQPLSRMELYQKLQNPN